MDYSNPSSLQPKRLGFSADGNATGDLLNLWKYRRIVNRENFKPGTYKGDITIVNLPQNDYLLGNIIDVQKEEYDKNIGAARQLSLFTVLLASNRSSKT